MPNKQKKQPALNYKETHTVPVFPSWSEIPAAESHYLLEYLLDI
jgi:hypothetical protein